MVILWAAKNKTIFPQKSVSLSLEEATAQDKRLKKTIVTVVVNFSEPEERDGPFSSLRRGVRTRGKTNLYVFILSEVKM